MMSSDDLPFPSPLAWGRFQFLRVPGQSLFPTWPKDWRSHLEGATRLILDLLFPPRCIGCGWVGDWLCARCRESIEWLRPPLCPLCGRPSPTGRLCPLCRRDPLRINGIRSVALFDGVLREAIHRLKYRGLRSLAVPLGQMLVDYWRAHPLPVDVVVPVPLHPRRERERGYNQAVLLAREFSKSTGLSLMEEGLARVRETPPQIGLNAAERKVNVRGAFRCQRQELRGKKVLLLDDVCTTGATLEACSMALWEAGARSVWGLTLARTP